jgi:hypothetical protein
MQSCLKAPVSPVSSVSTSKSVAIYTAIVGPEVEDSAFGINPAIEPSRLIAAIESPPRWAPVPWPPYPTDGQNDIKVLALAKLEAFFASGARPSNGPADEMPNPASACLPWAETTQLAPPQGRPRFRVRAQILTNGEPVWSYAIACGEKPAPEVESERRERDLGVFIQSLVRADLQRRIARRRFIFANRAQMAG